MQDDRALLRRYAQQRDEAAFAELVHRHINLVYSSALRRVHGNTHVARDLTQQVFVAVARNARALATHTAFTAWLFTATRNAVVDHVRRERRRQGWEQDALTLQAMMSRHAVEPSWADLRPVLDGAIDELDRDDRAAVLLRFFENRSFPEVGVALNVSEDAARMRVSRAVRKLRDILARRGVNSSAAALGVLMAQNGIIAAPAGLDVVVATSAATHVPLAAAGSGGLLGSVPLAKAALTLGAAAAAAALVLTIVSRAARQTEENVFERSPAEHSTVAGAAQTRDDVGVRFERNRSPEHTIQSGTGPVAHPPNTGFTVEGIETGRRFLAAHPEVLRALAALRHRAFERNWGFPLRRMTLAPGTREQIERRTCDALPWIFAIDAQGWRFGFDSHAFAEVGAIAERELRSALGDVDFETYREWYARGPIHELVETIAVAAYEAGAPLTPAQSTRLVQAIQQNGSQRREIITGSPLPGARLASLSLAQLDWDSVNRDVAPTFEPTQLAAVQVGRRSFDARIREEREQASHAERAAVGAAAMSSIESPPLQARAVDRFHADLSLKYAQFYRDCRLDAGAIAAFEELMSEHEGRRRDLRAAERTIRPSGSDGETREAVTSDGRRVRVAVDRSIAALQRHEDERFKAAAVGLLGNDGVARLQDFEQGADSRALVAQFVAELSPSAKPLSLEQGQHLTAVLQMLNYRRTIEPQNNTWGAIIARARPILAPDQMVAWESFITQARGMADTIQLPRLIDQWRKQTS